MHKHAHIWAYRYNIDGWLHTTPLFVIVGLMYSIIGSIILLIKKSR